MDASQYGRQKSYEQRVISNNTDKEWELLGKQRPYFGVLSDKEYASSALDPEAAKRFFETGEDYIALVFEHIRKHLDERFAPKRALDFGCGVGRLLIPIASRSGSSVGVDISPSMLDEARKNCARKNIGNAAFAGRLEELAADQSFDFINSFIVLQHIPVARGLEIIRALSERLAPGGCAALHMTYRDSLTGFARLSSKLKKRFQLFNYAVNLIKGRPISTPYMQMNEYPLNQVQWELQKLGCREFHSLFTNHGGPAGQVLLFQKPLQPLPLKA